MMEYKKASFFTQYFSTHPDFKVLEKFKKSEDEEEMDENIYVGIIEVLNTIYPLVLRVEIPVTFPHHHLVFRTKSLSGYPHLIHNGKTRHGDWFCLNTPFAETAEEQLNQEVLRLKEWIHRQMREDLPPVIEDFNVRKGLAIVNAYDWENLDEVNEFSSKAMLTFVGDFQYHPQNFPKKTGFLHCIKTPDDRFYALSNSYLTNYELPYVLVDEKPKILNDFVQLKEQFGWNQEICRHLLLNFSLHNIWEIDDSFDCDEYDQSSALQILDSIENELSKSESYLPAINKSSGQTAFISTKINSEQKELIVKELTELRKSIIDNEGISPWENCPFSYSDDEEDPYELYNRIKFEWHHFALGIKHNDAIFWYILYTNHNSEQFEIMTVDIGIKKLNLRKQTALPLAYLLTQNVSDSMFFGRGSFSEKMRSAKVAIVGLGAIGSMVAESLAHSGISKMGLWDNDIVEPGNICRSVFSLKDMGQSKVNAVSNIIRSINPYIKTDELKTSGSWLQLNINRTIYHNGSFYGNVNYENQDDAIKEIKDYDLIIDCTGSNEILHFLSYAVPEQKVMSLCITNHANELLCVTNRDGNPFELRKAYLSRIEQDTHNYYLEGSGCYSPTFLATHSDIASLVHLAMKDLDTYMKDGELMHSVIYSHTQSGVLADRIHTYWLEEYDILLNIPNEVILDAEAMDDVMQGNLGYLLGTVSSNGMQISITHVVHASSALAVLKDAFRISKGIIDYIGDYAYSGEQHSTFSPSSLNLIASKAEDETININNPLLAVRNPDRSVSFFLYINGQLVPFIRQ